MFSSMQETPDHLLYPNPASHMVHDEHLQYFEFMGKILGKVIFFMILRTSIYGLTNSGRIYNYIIK